MDVTNVNRQLMATTKTVGQVKVEALILLATSLPSAGEDRSAPKFYSSMGAALKLDPTSKRRGKRFPRPYHCHLWFHAGRISHSRRHKAISYNRAGSS